MQLCRLAVSLLTFFFSGDHTPEMPSSNRVTRHNQIRISRQCRSTRKRLGGGTPYSCYSHSSQVGSFEDLHQCIRINFIFPTGLIVVLKGQTSLPWWSYIVALVLGGFITVRFLDVAERQRFVFIPCPQPFSTLLYGRMGTGVATNQLMKMVPGALNPGKPVANLYVCARCLTVLSSLKIPLVFDVESRCCSDIHQSRR